MATLQVSDQQLEVILDALSMAQRRCEQLADQAEDRSIRTATRAVASQYGDLRRQIKDGLLNALVHKGARDPLAIGSDASSSAPS